MGKTKYSYEFVKKEFENRGYELVSDNYVNVTSKLQYICKKHCDKGIQEISFSKFHGSKQGCYYCGREKTEASRRTTLNKEADKELCEKHNFTYVDTKVENHAIVIYFICNHHQELGIQKMRQTNMRRGIKGCQYCSGKNLPEWYVMKKMKEVNPNIELLEPYNNLTTRINCICTKHNRKTRKTPQEILKGQGCYECGLEKLSKNSTLSLEEYQILVSDKNPDIIVLEYYGQHSNAKFRCKLCGYEWYGNAASMKAWGVSCPECTNYYTGEKEIKNLLEQWGYQYIPQYRFKGCIDQRTLPFDFYLPDYRTCIEYDGLQHFKETWFGKKSFEKTQKHDEIKNNYCEENNINLIRISCFSEDIKYDLFDQMVKHGLIEEIKLTA